MYPIRLFGSQPLNIAHQIDSLKHLRRLLTDSVVTFLKKRTHRGPTLSWSWWGVFFFTKVGKVESATLCRRCGKWKESFQLRLWNLNSTPNSPVAPRRLSCHIKTNIEKHVPRIMTSLLMSSSSISISHPHFRSSSSNPETNAVRAPRRACRQAKLELPRR